MNFQKHKDGFIYPKHKPYTLFQSLKMYKKLCASTVPMPYHTTEIRVTMFECLR